MRPGGRQELLWKQSWWAGGRDRGELVLKGQRVSGSHRLSSRFMLLRHRQMTHPTSPWTVRAEMEIHTKMEFRHS